MAFNRKQQIAWCLPVSVRLLPLLFLLVGINWGTARAQTASPPAKETPAATAQDIAPLFDAVDDLGEMRVLNPLQLTAEELDKMAAAIAESQAEYNKKMAATAAPILRKVGDIIHKARVKALAGGEVMTDDAVSKAMTDYAAARKKIEDATLVALSTKLQTILTAEQIKAAAKVAKDEQAKANGSASKGTDAQWFNLYTLKVILGYGRMSPSLAPMSAAPSGDPGLTTSVEPTFSSMCPIRYVSAMSSSSPS